MAGTARDNFSQKTKSTIAKRAAYRCSWPECNKLTVGPGDMPDGTLSIGVAAHIRAAATGGPRYDPGQSPKERSSQENGIWLCQDHQILVDADVFTYNAELLHKWKAEHEAQIRDEFGKPQVSKPLLPWPDRPGAPSIKAFAGFSEQGLGCSLTVTNPSNVGGLQARWDSECVRTNWIKPMDDNSPPRFAKFSLKAAPFTPIDGENQVKLMVQFYLDGDSERHGRSWTWRVKQVQQGTWRVDPNVAPIEEWW